jgi:hypothetical protein
VAATKGGVGSDPEDHPDSEQLALLAMEAETETGVKEHVAQCAACDRDLAVIRSLLDSEGPDECRRPLTGVASPRPTRLRRHRLPP